MLLDHQKEFQRYKKNYSKKFKSFYDQPLIQASLSLVLSLAAVSFFALFALKPTLVTIATLWQEIKTKKEVDQKLTQKIKALKQAEISFAQAEKEINFIDKALPQTADFLRLEREIEFLSFKNNLVLSSARFGNFDIFTKTTPQETEDGQERKEGIPLTFRLTLGGSFQNLKNFLSDLESLDRVATLDKISFSKETEIENAELQIALTGKLYYLPPEE